MALKNIASMKKLFLAFVLAILCLSAQAQVENLKPGIYHVSGDVFTPLKSETSVKNENSATNRVGMFNVSYVFKNPTAPVAVSDGSFVMVTDPSRKAMVQTLKKFNPFVAALTPDNMLLVPLTVKKNKRSYTAFDYDEVRRRNPEWEHVDFSWERLSDNSYSIKADLVPGEYAFAFRISETAIYTFDAVYSFCVK